MALLSAFGPFIYWLFYVASFYVALLRGLFLINLVECSWPNKREVPGRGGRSRRGRGVPNPAPTRTGARHRCACTTRPGDCCWRLLSLVTHCVAVLASCSRRGAGVWFGRPDRPPGWSHVSKINDAALPRGLLDPQPPEVLTGAPGRGTGAGACPRGHCRLAACPGDTHPYP
jgi:hypothetical protein